MDSNHDIVPTLRMFDGVMTGLAADEIERLRKRVAELEADAEAEPTMTSKLTERQRMDLLLVADDMSVSGDAALADALRALLAPTQQPSGEVTFERWRDSMSVNWWGNVTPIQAAAAAFNAARAQGGES